MSGGKLPAELPPQTADDPPPPPPVVDYGENGELGGVLHEESENVQTGAGAPASAPPLEAVIDIAARNQDMLVSDAVYSSFENNSPTLEDMPPRGTKVTVIQLVSNYSLNGKVGTVVGYRSDGAVLVDVDGISSAPLHPSNLSWGTTDTVSIPQPHFMQPKMNMVEKNGVCLIKVKPPSRHRDTTICCPYPAWSDMTFFKQIGWTFTNFLAIIFSWVLAFALLFFSPFVFGQAAVGWRWLAHRQMDMLLSASPPSRGAIVSRPTAAMKGGGVCGYLMSGHTWRCLIYVLFMSLPFGMITMCFCVMSLPCSILMCCRPLYSFGANLVYACLWMQRKLCVGMVGHIVCEYSLAGFEDATPQLGGATVEGGVDEETPVLTGDGLGEVQHQSSWLAQRERTREEIMAIEKFNSAYLRLFGEPPRLRDITIEPPREPGRGPRHFITVAETVSDTQRLKLVKAYKQAFSTMYVHIIDIEEQQRQEGTDYSALYS